MELFSLSIFTIVLLIPLSYGAKSSQSQAPLLGSQKDQDDSIPAGFGGYGDPCDNSSPCRSKSYLVCDSKHKVCTCPQQKDTIYDPQTKKCLLLVGSTCLGKVGQLMKDLNISVGHTYWRFEMGCVEGADCFTNKGGPGKSKTCQCTAGHYLDERRRCHKLQTYGEICSRHVQCNRRHNLYCIDGICGCDSGSAQAYQLEGSHTCLQRVGKKCTHSYSSAAFQCEDKATCPSENYAEPKFCVENSICENSTCFCEHKVSGVKGDGTCLKQYGQGCTQSRECEPGFHCLQQGCSCPHPDYQVYESERNACLGRLGHTCQPEKDDCDEGGNVARCLPSQVKGDPSHRCQCRYGYVEGRQEVESDSGALTLSSSCFIGYGFPCNSSHSTCDKVAGLLCKDGTCQCPNALEVYNERDRVCQKPVGYACTKNGDCAEGLTCESKSGLVVGNRLFGKTELGSDDEYKVPAYCTKDPIMEYR